MNAGGSDGTKAQVGDAIAFTVNGRPVTVNAPPLRRLADALRDDLGLTGTKVGCNAGDCGACTVLLDGDQVCSCMVPLAQAAGRSVETVEGLARNGQPEPPAAGLSAPRRGAMRHLHARHADRRDRGAAGLPASQRVRSHGRPRRRALPLHRLPQDCGGGAGCGGRCPAAAHHPSARCRRRRPARQARRRAQAHRRGALWRRRRAAGRPLAPHRPLAP